MKKLFIAVVMIAVFAGAAFAAGITDPMEFPSSNGTVTFWHVNHVNEVHSDCTVCHSGTPGPIPAFGMDYAHSVCISCHASPDGSGGPTKCAGCHVKQ